MVAAGQSAASRVGRPAGAGTPRSGWRGTGLVVGMAQARVTEGGGRGPFAALAGILLRKLLRYRCLDLLRNASPRGVYTPPAIPRAAAGLVPPFAGGQGIDSIIGIGSYAVFRPSVSIVLFSALAVGSFFVGCSSYTRNARAEVSLKPAGERKEAPDFALKDADGKVVHLSDYKGKVVLLDFWATWCGPCRMEIPWFIELQRDNKDRGFEVLGVSMDDNGWADVKPFLAEMKVNYRVVIGNDETATIYGGVESLPTTF